MSVRSRGVNPHKFPCDVTLRAVFIGQKFEAVQIWASVLAHARARLRRTAESEMEALGPVRDLERRLPAGSREQPTCKIPPGTFSCMRT